MPKFKHNERILKAAREKQLVTYKGAPLRLSSYFFFFTRNLAGEQGLEINIQGDENKEPTTKITLLSKVII